MVKKRLAKIQERLERKQLVKVLLKAPVYGVHFSKGWISLHFFGYKLSYKILVKREKFVGEWSRKHPRIVIDKRFSAKELRKSFKALCVHEAVEKFLAQHLHFRTQKEPHKVATQKEKEYLESIKGNWRSHELFVFWDWQHMGRH